MGVTFESVHVMNDTAELIHDEIVSWHDSEVSCLIGQEQDGRVPIYPNILDAEAFACRLSKCLHKEVLWINLYDDDVFYYTLFVNGEKYDTFCSCPDYFGETEYDNEETDQAESESNGNPERLIGLLKDSGDIERIAAVMEQMKTELLCETNLVEEFCQLLRLPEALCSFEDLFESYQEYGLIYIPGNS